MLDRPVPRAILHAPGAGHGPNPGRAPPPRRWRYGEGRFRCLPSVPELVEHGLGGRGPSVGQLEEDRRSERAGVRVGAHPHLRRRGSDGLSARARGPRVAACRRLQNDRDDPDPGLDRDRQRRQNCHLTRHRTVRQTWDPGGDRDDALEDAPGHGQFDPRREAWPAPREVEVRRIGDPVVVLRQTVASEVRRGGQVVSPVSRDSHLQCRDGAPRVPRHIRSPGQDIAAVARHPYRPHGDIPVSWSLDRNPHGRGLPRDEYRATRGSLQRCDDPHPVRSHDGVFELALLQPEVEAGFGSRGCGRDRGAQKFETSDQARNRTLGCAEIERLDNSGDRALQLVEERARSGRCFAEERG